MRIGPNAIQIGSILEPLDKLPLWINISAQLSPSVLKDYAAGVKVAYIDFSDNTVMSTEGFWYPVSSFRGVRRQDGKVD